MLGWRRYWCVEAQLSSWPLVQLFNVLVAWYCVRPGFNLCLVLVMAVLHILRFPAMTRATTSWQIAWMAGIGETICTEACQEQHPDHIFRQHDASKQWWWALRSVVETDQRWARYDVMLDFWYKVCKAHQGQKRSAFVSLVCHSDQAVLHSCFRWNAWKMLNW